MTDTWNISLPICRNILFFFNEFSISLRYETGWSFICNFHIVDLPLSVMSNGNFRQHRRDVVCECNSTSLIELELGQEKRLFGSSFFFFPHEKCYRALFFHHLFRRHLIWVSYKIETWNNNILHANRQKHSVLYSRRSSNHMIDSAFDRRVVFTITLPSNGKYGKK